LSTVGKLDLSLARMGYGVGACLSLLAYSPYHRELQVGAYISQHLLPAMAIGQFRMWQDMGHPTGYVTWRRVSEGTRKAFLSLDIKAMEFNGAWNYGPHLYINDVVFPDGLQTDVLGALRSALFRGETSALEN
jgi:hemolysin-activating ACP:hemolysin acyltransferase